jgi:hypothetical protein
MCPTLCWCCLCLAYQLIVESCSSTLWLHLVLVEDVSKGAYRVQRI